MYNVDRLQTVRVPLQYVDRNHPKLLCGICYNELRYTSTRSLFLAEKSGK
jgi:hypothetical protein